MTYNIITGGKYSFASAPAITDLDAYEKELAKCPNLDLWVTPKPTDIANEKAGLWLRDRKRGQTLERVGTQGLSATGLNSKPSFSFDANGYFVLNGYQIPPSFTILSALTYNSGQNFQNILGSKTQTGARIYFGFGFTSSQIRPWFDVSASSSDRVTASSALTNATNHVMWASFDNSNFAMRLGVDNVTPQYSQAATQSHKADANSALGGFSDSATYNFKDDIGPVLVFNAPLHTAGYEEQLATALSYLSNYSGVTVTGL